MPLERYRNTLIQEITSALSNDEIIRHCDAAVHAVIENRLHKHLIVRFIDKTIIVLDHHKHGLNHADERRRCSVAQIRLYELRRQQQRKLYN